MGPLCTQRLPTNSDQDSTVSGPETLIAAGINTYHIVFRFQPPSLLASTLLVSHTREATKAREGGGVAKDLAATPSFGGGL